MDKYLITETPIVENDKEYVYDKFSKRNLPFSFKTEWAITCKDCNKTMLKMTETVYEDDDFRRHVDVSILNQDKEIYKTEEFLSIDDKGNSRYHTVDIGCFLLFFGIIGYFEDIIDGKNIRNLTLSAYDYSGKFLGNYEPAHMKFEDYSENELAKLGMDISVKETEKEL